MSKERTPSIDQFLQKLLSYRQFLRCNTDRKGNEVIDTQCALPVQFLITLNPKIDSDRQHWNNLKHINKYLSIITAEYYNELFKRHF